MLRPVAFAVFLVAIFGCTTKSGEPGPRIETAQSIKPKEPDKQIASEGPTKAPAGDSHLVPVGKNVWLEVRDGHRRVLVDAYVCLRVGQLEEFLCRRYTKEHESILAADIDARDLHKALVLAGAEPGGPAEFDPVYKPAHGSHIKVLVQYQKAGKTVTLPAQEWIRDIEKKKPMAVDWVFAGSKLVINPLEPNKPPMYLANDGDVISISNFDCSLLDLPIRSTAENANLNYEAFTEKIPAQETKVRVILEPVEGEKGKKK